eukprot:TRINITY_DN47075_c0_g1_i1.p1 TRINITY_DN47075_c0_g1~~TRINITY_DN47075_c0_g1_i1.p1  ORF type:complete len:323 (+),score=37.54 TRINITY_DN47075_c0_g1_i1:89-1057(+)
MIGPAVYTLIVAAAASEGLHWSSGRKLLQANCPFPIRCDLDFPVNSTMNLENPPSEPVAYEGKPDNGKYWLFVIGAPKGGTSAMYALLSTSPAASNLCRGRWGLCEGTWDILGSLIPRRDKWGKKGTHWRPQQFPINWTEAVDKIYPNRWNMSQPVLLEKSPMNVKRMTEIYNCLKDRTDRQIKFVVVTTHPCFYSSGSWRMARGNIYTWAGFMRDLIGSMKHVPSEHWILVRMEDVFRDPVNQTRRLLNFLPALKSLSPIEPGLQPRNKAKKVDQDAYQDNRLKGIVGYIQYKKGQLTNKTAVVPGKQVGWILSRFGYRAQ